MEFRYNRRALIWFSLMLGFGLLGVIIYIYDEIKSSFHSHHRIYTTLVLLTSGFFGVTFYRKRLKTVFIVDEEGITLRDEGETFIRWADVSRVEVEFITDIYRQWRSSFILRIISLDKDITIGSEINNVRELITFMKSKLGDKFDTKDIPVEFKYKQR